LCEKAAFLQNQFSQKKTKKRAIIVYFKLFLAFFIQKTSKIMFFRMLKKRVFWRRSLFLIKTAKKRKMYFVQNKLKQVKNT